MLTGESRTGPWDALSHRTRRRLLLELYDEYVVDSKYDLELDVEHLHRHLPKLEDLGYIERDPDTGTIERGPNWDEIEPFIMMIDRHKDELPDDWL